MHIRTPKKYRTSRRNLVSRRWLLFWLFAIILISGGIFLYGYREELQPGIDVQLNVISEKLEHTLATAVSPLPTPTSDPGNDLILANDLWEGGAVTKALTTYKEIADATPNDPVIFERIALAAIVNGDIDLAIQAAQKAVNADPFSADAWAIQGWAYDWNDQTDQAIPSLLYALELNPDNLRARAYLAEAYLTSGQRERALELVNEVVEANPNSIAGHRARGLINWIGHFELQEALADFEIAYTLAQTNAPAQSILIALDMAGVQRQLGNHAQAIKILEDTLAYNTTNTRILYRLGYLYNMNIGDTDQAATYLSRCLQSDPEDVNCHYELGTVQYLLKEYQLAAESFTQAINFGSKDPYHFYMAGQTQLDLGDCDQALEYLRPGYEIAQQQIDESLVRNFESVISTCIIQNN